MGKKLALRIGTVGDLIPQRRTIWLRCEKCHHSAEQNPSAIIAAQGADPPVQRFFERALCGKCGARYPDIELKAPPARRGDLPVR
jgi:hypothetical protein